MDNEDVLATLSDNFVLLPLSDFTSILKPADLQGGKHEQVSDRLKTEKKTFHSQFIKTNRQSRCAHLDVLSGYFTFKPGRFLLFDFDIMEWL